MDNFQRRRTVGGFFGSVGGSVVGIVHSLSDTCRWRSVASYKNIEFKYLDFTSKNDLNVLNVNGFR